ncbi:MAG: DUF3467 domain-containing protein [Crocinitomicaceae bacterium]
MENNNENSNQLNIELNEQVAGGIYSNLAIITHSNSEFVADFVQIMPGVPKAQVRSRVIMSPENAKRLMKALAENISKYEAHNGVIKEDGGMVSPNIPMNFGGQNTEA